MWKIFIYYQIFHAARRARAYRVAHPAISAIHSRSRLGFEGDHRPHIGSNRAAHAPDTHRPQIQKTTYRCPPRRKPSPASAPPHSTPEDAPAPKMSALEAFSAQFNSSSHAATPSRGTGATGGPTVKLRGIITSAKQTTVTNASGAPCPKLGVAVAVTKISNPCAVHGIDPGVPGQCVLFAHAQGEEGRRRARRKGHLARGRRLRRRARRAFRRRRARAPVCSTDAQKTVWLGFVRTGIFTEKGAGEKKAGADALVTGMAVEITGVTANFGNNDPTSGLYLNCTEIKPLASHACRWAASRTRWWPSSCSRTRSRAALLHSMSVQGFFPHEAHDPAQTAQVNVFRETWLRTAGAANACDSKATALCAEAAGSNRGLPAIRALQCHAARLRGASALDVASGAARLFVPARLPGENDPNTTFYAPIVHQKRSVAEPIPELLMRLFEGDETLPKGPRGLRRRASGARRGHGLLHAYGRFHFVGDTKLAIKACARNDQQPVLSSAGPVAGFKVGLRNEGPATVGTLNKGKAITFFAECIPHAVFTAVIGVEAKSPDDDDRRQVRPVLCDRHAQDAAGGRGAAQRDLRHAGARGRRNTVRVLADDAAGEQIEPKGDDHRLPPKRPTLAVDGYQAVSESSQGKARARDAARPPVQGLLRRVPWGSRPSLPQASTRPRAGGRAPGAAEAAGAPLETCHRARAHLLRRRSVSRAPHGRMGAWAHGRMRHSAHEVTLAPLR